MDNYYLPLMSENIDKDDIKIFVQFTYFARNLASLPIKHIQTDEQKNDYFPIIENIENVDFYGDRFSD